jgi:hypothetical protein
MEIVAGFFSDPHTTNKYCVWSERKNVKDKACFTYGDHYNVKS